MLEMITPTAILHFSSIFSSHDNVLSATSSSDAVGIAHSTLSSTGRRLLLMSSENGLEGGLMEYSNGLDICMII